MIEINRFTFPLNIIFVSCLLSLHIPGTQGTERQLTYYEGIDCSGRNESFRFPRDNQESRWFKNASSVGIIGLWKQTLVKEDFNAENGLSGYTILHRDAQPNATTCVNRKDMIPASENYEEYMFYSIDTFGAYILNYNVLILTTEPNFRGLLFDLMFDDNGTIIPRPMIIESIAIFGSYPWLLYPQKNFQGEAKCLYPTHKFGDGFTLFEPTKEVVGSVRRAYSETECEKPNVGTVPNTVPGIILLLLPVLHCVLF